MVALVVSVCWPAVAPLPAASAAAKPAWSIATFPSPPGSSTAGFEGVTCPSATSCLAVGSSRVGKTTKTLVEQWNGRKWSVLTSPNPAGATSSSFKAVACASATNCFAVGYDIRGTTTQSLVERWNGTSWSVTPSPSPATWADPSLDSVACPSATRCFAVGHGRSTMGDSLVEHWDGSTWSVVPVAKLSGWTETSFYGVTCASASTCFAVGFYQPVAEAPLRTLIEQWDGNAWSVVTSPSPAGALPATLARVSCPSVTSCFAVGSYSPKGGGLKTLIERWNGTSWSTMPSPNAQSATTATSDVSCATTTSCVAVGRYLNGANGRTLVERWTGTTWSIVTSPNPTGSTNSLLKGVSCPSASSCIAVGTATVKQTRGLIERYA